MKRYNSVNEVLKRRFGCKVFKVSLDSGCTCPNKDGAISHDGCIFCGEESYYVATGPKKLNINAATIKEELEKGILYVKKRHQASKFISYFQSGSNTNAKANKLRELFLAATHHPQVVGLDVATRPDCIKNEHLDLLEDFSKKTMLWVELGLQSANPKTLKLINRGHDVDEFIKTVQNLKSRNIEIIAHVILGLPGEDENDMLETAGFLNEMKIDGVKIHNLHVIKGTLLEKWYNEKKFTIPDLLTYSRLAVSFLEHLNPDILIHRLNGHAPRHLTVAPLWSVNKLAIFNAVEKELKNLDTWQGKKFSLPG